MKKSVIRILATCSILTGIAISIVAFSTAWFTGPTLETDDENLDGKVGLRSYFYAGDGSTYPFEIVTPEHLYNLSRLQNLGAFPDGTKFQIGHDFTSEELAALNQSELDPGLYCINNNICQKFLDMNDFCERNTILPIGGEGAPFNGVFDGNGDELILKNITVTGNPEDIGLFGYISSEGKVANLVCDNLNIVSLGYSSSEHDLYFPDLDNILSPSISDISKNMKLQFYDGVSGGLKELKSNDGLLGYEFDAVNDEGKVLGDSTVYNGYFVFTEPNDDLFDYDWRSSSPLITKKEIDFDDDGDEEEAIVIDMEVLKNSLEEDEDIAYTDKDFSFNSGRDMKVDARISLIASTKVNASGIVFTRVIQSYVVTFYSNYSVSYDEGLYSMSITCDYVDSGQDPIYTNYHHGNNIGLFAGHLDGTMENCYVYNGSFKFNESGYNPVYAETDIGLIGEIGTNVFNTIDPNVTLKENGDTGVMNFTTIYNLIRKDSSPTVTLNCGHTTTTAETLGGSVKDVNFISYDPFVNEDTFSLYEDYLRTTTVIEDAEVKTKYITSTSQDMSGLTTYPINSVSDIKKLDFNSVDFKWNNIIEDNYISNWDASTNKPSLKNQRDKGEIADNSRLPTPPEDGEYHLLSSENEDVYYQWSENRGKWLTSDTEPLIGSEGAEINSEEDLLMPGDYYEVSTPSNYYYQWDDDEGEWIVTTTSPSSGDEGNPIDSKDDLPDSPDDGEYHLLVANYFQWNPTFNNRGLGVFKLATSYCEAARSNPTNYSLNNIGESRIINGNPRTKVYFSTAEYDHSKGGSFNAFRPTSIPSYSDVSSFDYPFSRDYNYCIEMDLSQSTDPNASSKNYLWNVKNPFLIKYLKSKLINKIGASVPYKSSDFGFMFKLPNDTEAPPISSLSSYMPLQKPGKTKNIKNDGHYYPPNSIVFDIDNASGANVSVVGNNADITIYKFKTTEEADPIPLYSMKSANSSTQDQHRYFSYDYITGEVGTKASNTYTVEAIYDENDEELILGYKYTFADGRVYTYYLKEDEEGTPEITVDDDGYYLINGETTGIISGGTELIIKDDDNWMKDDGKGGVTRTSTVAVYDEEETIIGYKYTFSDGTKYTYYLKEGEEGTPTFTTGYNGNYWVNNEDTGIKANGVSPTGGELYAHIFKLPKLDPGWEYAIGAKNSNETANLYFLAVQGQDFGNVGTKSITQIGSYVEGVDFITMAPDYDSTSETYNPYPFDSTRANFTFKGTFNSNSGLIKMTSFEYNAKNYMQITFKETDNFVTLIYGVSRDPDEDYRFKINSKTYGKDGTYVP